MAIMSPGSVRIRVSELLKERGMNVTDLANATGLSYGTALMLERGAGRRLDFETLARVCAALEVQVSDVLIYEDEEPEPA